MHFITNCTKLFVLVVLTNLVQCQVGHKRVCGHVNVSDNASFDIYDRDNHNLAFAEILKSDDTHEKIYSADIQPDCELIYCFIDLFHGKKRTCEHFRNFVDLSSENYTYSVSLSCSCKAPASGCNNTHCQDVTLPSKTCAQFYKEKSCSECRYEPFQLAENVTVNPTNNSFLVYSLAVKQNCSLEVKSYGTADPNSASYTYYEGTHNYIELSYFQKYKPAEFLCRCGEVDKIILTTPDPSSVTDENFIPPREKANPLSDPLIVSLIALVILALVLGSASIGVVYWRAKRKLSKFSDEAVRRFTDGSESINTEIVDNVTFNEHGSGGGSSAAGKCNYVALGYLEALKQPYFQKYEIARENLVMQENVSLGKGNFGQVCPGKLLNPNGSAVDVAIKIAKGSTSMIYFVSLLDEIKILTYIGSHPNVVGILGACTKNIRQRDALLLLELCSKGNLKNYLKTNLATFVTGPLSSANGVYQKFSAMTASSTHTTESAHVQFLVWAHEIASGMEFLSTKKVVHIDLAARNILLTDNLTAKVSDFGLSRRIQNAGNYARIGDKYGLPISWMALESLRQKRFTVESDVWSYGVTLWEIFSLGSDPYEGMRMSLEELIAFLQDGKRLLKPAHATDEIYSEMCKCWAGNPSERPLFNDLMEYFGNLQH